MLSKPPIRLFWWSEILLQGQSKENYGDLLGYYLSVKISKRSVKWVHPKHYSWRNYFEPIFFTVGSILAHVNSNSVVWGSGIISKNEIVKKAKFLAVRGPQTRQLLLTKGYEVPAVYGDPALLLPLYYAPRITTEYQLGIIPHISDFEFISQLFQDISHINVINLLTNDVEETTKAILKCERIISSSLHGIIVSHAYGIPAIWNKFSDKLFGDDIKFQDYFKSIKIEFYRPEIQSPSTEINILLSQFEIFESLPKEGVVKSLQEGLIASCPFANS